jgi:hypothetical protein
MDFTPHAGTPARPRPLRFFEEARLEAYGYALTIIYAVPFTDALPILGGRWE